MSSQSDENRKLSQDEIISNTKNVVRGLETLKNEHSGILKDIGSENNGETNVKTDILKTSLEKIELGIGEAQVKKYRLNIAYKNYCDLLYMKWHQ